jgi:hypothetical protein
MGGGVNQGMLKGWIVAAVCLAVFLWAFVPGLYGGFYLDDYPNLSPLGYLKDSSLPLLSFLVDPAVGGLGRPISYLTFLAQYESWPDNPFDFKVVNLFIHGVNGLLVYFLALLILRIKFGCNIPRHWIKYAALLATFTWLILPIQVSTVFYVVQRMTLLSTSFVLLSLVGYLWLRTKVGVWNRKHYLVACFAVGIGYLGIFAKENAVLTGLLILVCEFTLLSKAAWRPNRIFVFGVLVAPLVLVILYLLLYKDILAGYAGRDFTLYERLSTQAVVIWEYLAKVFFPSPARLHLYNDGFKIYGGLLSDPRVVFSLLALLLGLAVSLRSRSKYPLFTFGFLFYLSAHLLESSFLPLELRFDHRNYLPLVGLIIGLVGVFLRLWQRVSENGLKRRLVAGVACFYLLFFVSVSALESRVWGDEKAFALSSLIDRPLSIRAQQEAAAFFVSQGDYMAAANILYSINDKFGRYAGTYAQMLVLSCIDERVVLPSKSEIIDVFSSSGRDRGLQTAMQNLWEIIREDGQSCNQISYDDFLDYLSALSKNDSFQSSSNLKILKSFVYADAGEFDRAVEIVLSIPENRRNLTDEILIIRYLTLSGDRGAALRRLSRLISSDDGLDNIVYKEYLIDMRSRLLSSDQIE